MVVSPGRKLRAVIEERGLDQIKVADSIGVTRQTVNNIVNDRQPISRDMANRLARLTGRTPGYWLQSEFSDGDEPQGAQPGMSAAGATILVDHQIIQAIDDGVIGIKPFDPAQVQAASIDLRLGDWVIPAGGEPMRLGHGEKFILGPRQTANVQTLEWVSFPDNHIGRVGAMTQPARFGIIMAHGFQVDPNYQGHLQFCLFNSGASRYELVSGAPVISLEVTRLGSKASGGKVAPERGRDDVQAVFDPARACVILIQKWLAPYVETTPVDGKFVARIPALNVVLAHDTEEDAIASAVNTALARFHSVSTNPRFEALRPAFTEFFSHRARRLYLGSDAARNAAQILGCTVEDDIVILRDGRYLLLPTDNAEVGFETFADQLGTPAGELILALTRSLKSGSDEHESATVLRVDRGQTKIN